jgi:sugar lactone lactonase YvrE
MYSRFFPLALIGLLAIIIFISCGSKSTSPPTTPERQVTTFAGNTAQAFVNATGTDARFLGPRAMTIDATGNLYVVDGNFIRKVTPAAVVTTYAGSPTAGYQDGPAATAKFNGINSLAFDQSGNLYVNDFGNVRVRKISSTGEVSTIAGDGTLGNTNGPPLASSFSGMGGIAIDASGNIFVGNANTIRKIPPTGNVSTYASSPGGPGMRNGPLSEAQFFAIDDLAFDVQGNLLVIDNGANRRIRKITPDGIVSTLSGNGSSGNQDSPNGESSASFNFPRAIDVDAQGNVYVADYSNHNIRKITPTGATTTIAGSPAIGFQDGNASTAKFNMPLGIAVDASGNIFVSDLQNYRIRRISSN